MSNGCVTNSCETDDDCTEGYCERELVLLHVLLLHRTPGALYGTVRRKAGYKADVSAFTPVTGRV
jgi:hypothetical protein